MAETEQPTESPKSPWQPRFGLGTLLLITIVFCIMSTAGYHLLRTRGLSGVVGSQTSPQAVFIIFTIAAPMLLLVALSGGRWLALWLGRPSRRKDD